MLGWESTRLNCTRRQSLTSPQKPPAAHVPAPGPRFLTGQKEMDRELFQAPQGASAPHCHITSVAKVSRAKGTLQGGGTPAEISNRLLTG